MDARPAGWVADEPRITRGGGRLTFLLEGSAMVKADSFEDVQKTLRALCEIVSERDLPPFATRVVRFSVFDENGVDVTP